MRIMRLYIIGNGFDLHHDLRTSYSDFGKFLNKRNISLYDQLLDYFGFEDVAGYCPEGAQLWSDFENSLAELDAETVYEAFRDSLANPGAESFRDRDWNTFAIEIGEVVESLTDGLFGMFSNFFKAVEYPQQEAFLNINPNARFLSFNYTKTLQEYYDVSASNVLHIHGEVSSGDEIILGHGLEPDTFAQPEAKPPEGLSAKELDAWYEHMSDQFDLSFEMGKAELERYFSLSFKNTKQVITDHTDFFDSLDTVDEIFILGHSLSDVDLPYFDKVATSVNQETSWIVSYHTNNDISHHNNQLRKIGINNPVFKQLKDL